MLEWEWWSVLGQAKAVGCECMRNQRVGEVSIDRHRNRKDGCFHYSGVNVRDDS